MSEMKPKVWIDPEYLPSPRHELTGTILRLEKDGSETMPLYTAEQLAEAVAAERERCAKVCKDARLNEISAPADWHNDACEDCIRAIRSASK